MQFQSRRQHLWYILERSHFTASFSELNKTCQDLQQYLIISQHNFQVWCNFACSCSVKLERNKCTGFWTWPSEWKPLENKRYKNQDCSAAGIWKQRLAACTFITLLINTFCLFLWVQVFIMNHTTQAFTAWASFHWKYIYKTRSAGRWDLSGEKDQLCCQISFPPFVTDCTRREAM